MYVIILAKYVKGYLLFLSKMFFYGKHNTLAFFLLTIKEFNVMMENVNNTEKILFYYLYLN